MKQLKNNQQGSAHAVLVICLVAALITALGWIFYQNFIFKEPIKKNTEVLVVEKKNDSNVQSEGRTDSNEGYLVVKEWGVKYKLTPDIKKITYEYFGDSELVRVTSATKDDDKTYVESGSSFGALRYEKASYTDPTTGLVFNADAQIGDKYYFSMKFSGGGLPPPAGQLVMDTKLKDQIIELLKHPQTE